MTHKHKHSMYPFFLNFFTSTETTTNSSHEHATTTTDTCPIQELFSPRHRIATSVIHLESHPKTALSSNSEYVVEVYNSKLGNLAWHFE